MALETMNIHPTILIAEDSESDRMLIELGFERARFPFSVQFARDGICASEYLDGLGRYANRAKFPLPIILLTDLKMPRMDGFELLEWVRNHPTWHKLPVIVVTGSDQSEDWRHAMQLGANSYVVKDLLMRPSRQLLDSILHYASPAGTTADAAWEHKTSKA